MSLLAALAVQERKEIPALQVPEAPVIDVRAHPVMGVMPGSVCSSPRDSSEQPGPYSRFPAKSASGHPGAQSVVSQSVSRMEKKPNRKAGGRKRNMKPLVVVVVVENWERR